MKTIDELFPPKKKHSSIIGMVPDATVEQFKQNLQQFQNAVGFSWLLREEPPAIKFIKDIEEIVFSEEYLMANDKTRFICDSLKMSSEEILKISTETIGQSSNEKWLMCRKNRLTSSNFGAILRAVENHRYPQSLFFFYQKAIVWMV